MARWSLLDGHIQVSPCIFSVSKYQETCISHTCLEVILLLAQCSVILVLVSMLNSLQPVADLNHVKQKKPLPWFEYTGAWKFTWCLTETSVVLLEKPLEVLDRKHYWDFPSILTSFSVLSFRPWKERDLTIEQFSFRAGTIAIHSLFKTKIFFQVK
jgi:hypothetical protein